MDSEVVLGVNVGGWLLMIAMPNNTVLRLESLQSFPGRARAERGGTVSFAKGCQGMERR
jgi:hypothetical protein